MASDAIRRAIGVGGVLGIVGAASPVTAAALLCIGGCAAWTARNLGPRERRWFIAIVVIAVALRLLIIAGLFLTSDGPGTVSFFWDGDGIYLKKRASWVLNVWRGVPIAPSDFANAFDPVYGWSTYIYVIAYLQLVMGPAPFGIHVFNVSLFMIAALLLYRAARSGFGRHAALGGLTLLLFMPTPFCWSVSALKEPWYLFLQVVGTMGAAAVIRSSTAARRVAGGIAVCLALAGVADVRTGAFLITAAGITLGVAGYMISRRRVFMTVFCVVLPILSYLALRNDSVQTRLFSHLTAAATYHVGHVRTPGHAYKLLDQHFYTTEYDEPPRRLTPGEAARFVARAVVSFIVVPLPWQISSLPEIVFLPQQVLWYVLVVFGTIGVVAGLRDDALLTWLLGSVAVTGSAVIALHSGNIGTMVRFRDTIVPFVVWFSAFGVVVALSRFAEMRNACRSSMSKVVFSAEST